MIDAPLLFAFTAGMVATINPCGLALLPAYVGAFVAGDDLSVRADRRLARAVVVSLTVATGFAVLFTLVGSVLTAASSTLRDRMPWVTMAVGLAMVVMGIAALFGRRLRMPLPAGVSSGRADLVGMFGFGFSYALVSLSCTIGPFLSVTGFAMNRSALGGVLTYLAYAAGMGSIILALSVAAVLAHESFVDALRSTSRIAGRLAGVLLVLSGSYAVWYSRYELTVYAGSTADDQLVEFGDGLRVRFLVLIESVGPARIGLAIACLTALTYVGLRLHHRLRRTVDSPPPARATVEAAREESTTP